VAPGCDLAEAARLAERLRDAVSGRPIDIAGASVSLTVSLGAAVAGPAISAQACYALPIRPFTTPSTWAATPSPLKAG